MQLYISDDLMNWSLWDVPGNEPCFHATSGPDMMEGTFNPVTDREMFLRWHLIEP